MTTKIFATFIVTLEVPVTKIHAKLKKGVKNCFRITKVRTSRFDTTGVIFFYATRRNPATKKRPARKRQFISAVVEPWRGEGGGGELFFKMKLQKYPYRLCTPVSLKNIYFKSIKDLLSFLFVHLGLCPPPPPPHPVLRTRPHFQRQYFQTSFWQIFTLQTKRRNNNIGKMSSSGMTCSLIWWKF